MAGNHEVEEWTHDLRRGVTRRDFLAAGVGTLVVGAAAVGIGWSSSNGSTSPTDVCLT